MVSVSDAEVPPSKAKSGADRQRAYNRSEKGKAVRKRYRHNNSKHQTDAQYLSREFRAIDGEGVTLPDGSHIYTMLAARAYGASVDVKNTHGLKSAEIFGWLLDNCHGDAINVIYGGSYDFNMWLSDFTRDELYAIYKARMVTWRGYRLAWRAGKSFFLARVDSFGRKIGNGVTIYDVASFFQCPFVKACDDYLGANFYERELVVASKAARGTFTVEDEAEVRRYNDAELINLIRLMEELRARLNKVGLRPRRWDGPGAVAAALLQRENVKAAKAECPPEVAQAARFAYAGGRFEVIKFGHVQRPAYEYDVNSAYPAALRDVPDLANGVWVHEKGPGDGKTHPFALYHITSVAFYQNIPAPLFRRDTNGTICYPKHVTGWYWSPEYDAVKAYAEAGLGTFTVKESWRFVPNVGATKPFAFIEPLYNKRRALKKAGDGAHVGVKLGLNSLYGKLAQQVGWERTPRGLRIPPYHQLEWAGYTTSYCRARVLMACIPHIDDVIAFETDAVFTAVPLDVPLSSNLGDFEETRFANLTYIQSGLYFGDSDENISKTRGVDRGNLSRAVVLQRMGVQLASERMAEVRLTRFVGAGVALAQNFERWRRWETATKEISLEPTGKRIHWASASNCGFCGTLGPDFYGIAKHEWHDTLCPFLTHEHSCEFPIEWINPNAEMTELAELRETPNDWDEYEL